MISCSTIKFMGNPTTTKLIDYNKKEPLAEYEKKILAFNGSPQG